MKRKRTRKELKEKSEEVKGIIKGLVNETIDIPNNSLILDTDVLIEIFTKKRMELIKYINKFKPESIQELSKLTGRKKQAVDRDIKLLERHELLSLKRDGRNVMPRIEKKFLITGLTDIYPIEISRTVDNTTPSSSRKLEEPISAQVYVDGVNVNQVIQSRR